MHPRRASPDNRRQGNPLFGRAMPDSLAPKPRRWRLQFSLRLLLLAFTGFAIGFPIWYRWPFEVTEHNYRDPRTGGTTTAPTSSVTRTWRRNWGVGKVLHGRSVTDVPWASMRRIEHYDNGVLHGKYEIFMKGKLTTTGHYDRGQREGTWVEYDSGTTCTARWHQDKLDGLYETAFNNGVKQQYHFAMGRLIDANGKPVKARLFDQLAAGGIDDPDIASALPRAMSVPMQFVECPLKVAVTFLQDAHGIPIVIDARRVIDVDLPLTVNLGGIDLCSALALLAAPHDLAFEFRYGVLRLTTAEYAAEEHDPTGVSDIHPTPGTPLARAWNEACTIQVVELPLDQTLQKLGQPLAIGFDLTALPPDGIPPEPPVTKKAMNLRRPTMPVTMSLRSLPLKHALALLLDDLELRCEARGGDTIVILPPKAP